eukprot:g37992.t1
MSEHQPLPQQDQQQIRERKESGGGPASNGTIMPVGGAVGGGSLPTTPKRHRGEEVDAGEKERLISAKAEDKKGCSPGTQESRSTEHESYQIVRVSCSNDAESVCSSNSSFRNGGITPTCRICFQGSEQ